MTNKENLQSDANVSWAILERQVEVESQRVRQEAIDNDIVEFNLAYLILAQKLLRDNIASAMFRLGLDQKGAEHILSLTSSDLVKLAKTKRPIVDLRHSENTLKILTETQFMDGSLVGAHQTILSSNPIEAFDDVDESPRPKRQRA